MSTLLEKTQEILTERNKITPSIIKGGQTVFGITGDYVQDLTNLVPSVIKKGVTVNNVTGQYTYRPPYVSFRGYQGNTLDFDTLGYEVPTALSDNCTYMFSNMPNVDSLDLSRFDVSGVTNMSYMFYSNPNITNITFGSNWDSSNVVNMDGMFQSSGNSYYTSNIDFKNLNTSSVTNMYFMFGWFGCTGLLDLSSFNTSNVTNMSYMFYDCNSTSIDLSSFDLSSASNISYMFTNSSIQSLDLSSFNTSTVTNMQNILSSCNDLQSITFGSNWVSYGTQTYSDDTTNIWTRTSDNQSYTGLQALLEAGRTKGAIEGTWIKS